FLKAHPDAALIRSNLGAALVHEGRYADAVREYKLALAADPANTGIRFNLALAYYKSGDLTQAVPQFDTVRKTAQAADPQQRRATVLEAECYLAQGNDKRTIELLEPLASDPSSDLATLYLLGTALIHDNQQERGAAMIKRILATGDTAQAHMLIAFTRMKSNDKKGAMAEVLRTIELDPALAEAHNLHGRLLFLDSDLAGAEAAFRKALSIDPNLFESLLFLGTLLRQQGNFAEARRQLERAVHLQPADARVRYQLAVLDSAEEKDQRAAAELEALIKEVPGFEEAHRSLSSIYFRLGRAADGRREREIAEKLDAETQAKDLAIGRTLKQ
ncbi:MAG: tetratricopeptide repeat protein, partial [Acidobacteriaceae bacterium]|nr:tetratricopeptide repeat protein [Acidobacteriaceae bacterium]